MTLPFATQVAANAVWKVMSTDKIRNHCYDHRVSKVTVYEGAVLYTSELTLVL